MRRACIVMLAVLLASAPRYAYAAPGDLIAEVLTSEGQGMLWARGISPSVAFDGQYIYYVEYAGSVLHRIDVPPAGSSSSATGQIDAPISGAGSGIISLAYDAGRGLFWAVGGDGLSVYTLTRGGVATLRFRVDPLSDRPGFQAGGPYSSTEIKIAYDRADDTIWYSPDATTRIYHYATTPDELGTAALVTATPYVDVGVAPNDMTPECGYSQSSGVATGGAHLFISVSGCNYLFEYTKTGVKVAAYLLAYDGPSTQDLECDDVSYSVPVFWIRDGYDGHIRAFEQPSSGACVFGGGAAPIVPTPTPVTTPPATTPPATTPPATTPPVTPTPLLTLPPLPTLNLPTLPPPPTLPPLL